ncbi:GTP cyclohydrolase [Cupriavidus respiraculi]|uniref:Uncharacterized protein n=1 Tax=Cupriavidus respiraculi TaxID=195930 RepID=A0ABN7Z0R6_9BURK|nr:GTP cyclohydrolase [Cupriavidus respiraculi]MBY4948891.1 GTP cyclohydrolase [Cupriavidus respiraculi]CAG9177892.1 hypothetical protein LMG21510_03428 [Cupriavidus respiraculi]
MVENNAVYKGFRVSAHVQRSLPQVAGAQTARLDFHATVSITRVNGGNESLQMPSPLPDHSGHTPRAAIEAAVVYARTVIDGMSTFTKAKK